MTKIFSLKIKEGNFVKEIPCCKHCPLCMSDEFGSRCALLIFDYGVFEEHLIGEIVHEMCHLPDKDPFTPLALEIQEAPMHICTHARELDEK